MTERGIFRLGHSQDGVTVIEFGLLAPVLLTMVMGLMDLAHNMYTAQMLQGAIQQAARSSTLEGASGAQSGLDQIVTTAVHTVAPGASITFARKSYANFTNANRGEDFTDLNNNGLCDSNEPYEDANANGAWDADAGTQGFGGARDAVLYTVTVQYERFFPVFAFIPGQTSHMTMSASTVLRNQPYGADQERSAPPVRNCT